MQEMRSRVSRITEDLNALLEEMGAMGQGEARDLVERVVTPDLIRAFKASVDAMRRMLWTYIDEASRNASAQNRSPYQVMAMQGVVDALQSMRASGPPPGSVGSFIEIVEAIVEKTCVPSQPASPADHPSKVRKQ